MLHTSCLLKGAAVVALLWLTRGSLLGQENLGPLPGAAARFGAAERQLNEEGDYWAARERLAEQALQLAEQDLSSEDAGEVLRWVLRSPRSTPSTKRAASLLANSHGTSRSTIEWLLNLQPRAWTPALFAAVAQEQLPPDERARLEVCMALHDLALLKLSDEIKALKGDFSEFHLRLGKALTTKLRNLDGSKRESQLIETFQQLADRHGDRVIGGVTVRDLADGASFEISHLRLGKRAEGLAGISLSDKQIALSQFRGHVVLVDFWATWCAPCVAAMPQLKNLNTKLQGEEFVILDVNADQDSRDVKEFVDDRSISWPTILDRDGKLQKRWMALSLPTYFVLDQDHVVRYRGSQLTQAANVAEAILGKDGVSALVRATLQAFDKNDDQRIEKDELPADKQAIMDTVDLNKDGFLTVEELTTFTTENMTAEAAPAEAGDKRG